MTRSAAGNRFRTRKLSTKQQLQVVREHQIDSIEDDAQRSIPQIDTGVERQEEVEHHLQAAISAAQTAVATGKAAQIFIPTPSTSKTVAQYDLHYPKRFSQPTSYIRFSSTVEDCGGTPYCMDEEDDEFLRRLNATKRSSPIHCSEDTFEVIMQTFESTVQAKQPFLAMDISQIITYEEMEAALDENNNAKVRAFAKLVYPYWKERRIKTGGRPIMPILKFEQGQEKDDGDPYVCFRRREVRQARKTRRTDAQSTEKLKKLRQELEMARMIIQDVVRREKMRREAVTAESTIFDLRGTLKDLKRKHNIREDEDLLYNHKKKPALQAPPAAVRLSQQAARPGVDQRPPEAELTQLSEARRKKSEIWRNAVESAQAKRSYSNVGYEDLTEAPILDTIQVFPRMSNEYRTVRTTFLPTPPSSVSPVASPTQESDMSDRRLDFQLKSSPAQFITEPEKLSRGLPAYRRRIGRGGRTFIDRRRLPLQCPRNVDPIVIDRYKYDHSEDEDYGEFHVEGNSDGAIQYRARLLSPPPEHHLNPYSIRRNLPEAMTPAHLAQLTRA